MERHVEHSLIEFDVLQLQDDAAVAWGQLATGVVVSAIVAYLSIEFFMRFVSRIGLMPFAIYRLALAAVIVYVLV